jgi:DNA polymerase I-like protein with 3'-5' exonuclease and polymerase domains
MRVRIPTTTQMLFSFDTETTLITEDEPTPEMVCGSYAFHSNGEMKSGLLLPQDFVEAITGLLHDPEVEFVGLNLAFDFRVIVRAGVPIELVFAAYEAGRVLDLGLTAHLHDIAQGRKRWSYSLQELMRIYLHEHLEKEDTWRLRYGELRGIPLAIWPSEAIEYAIKDAESPLRLVSEIPESKDARRQAAWDWWLSLSGAHGFRTDPERVLALRERCIREAAELILQLPDDWISIDKHGVLHKHTGTIRKYAEKFPNIPRTGKKKEKSLAFEDLKETGDPYLVAYAKLGQRLSILDNDLGFLTRPRVRTRYGLADTGRTTSSGSDEIACYTNLQNLKTDAGVRECLIPDEGHVLLISDYDGLELCTIAQCCMSLLGRSKLAELLRDPHGDAHSYLAAIILGITYEEALKRKKNKGAPEYSEFYNARQTAKVCNFGLAGGAGAEAVGEYGRLNYGVKKEPQEWSELKEKWFTAFPEMRDYLNIGAMGDPTVVQLFVGRVRGGCGYTVINNTKFQGLGGDITKAAGFQIAKECYAVPSSPLYGCRIVAFVHDEFIISCPRANMVAAAKRLKELMTTGAPAKLSPDVPLRTEPVIAARWSKAAEPVVVDGVVIPWEDFHKKDKESGRWIDKRTGQELRAA